MGILNPGRYLTDPTELIPPVVIDLENNTQTLQTAFYQAMLDLAESGTLTYGDIDKIIDSIESFDAISKNRYRTLSEKQRTFAQKMNQVLDENDECKGLEFNAFFDAKRLYQRNRLKPSKTQKDVMTRLRNLLDIFS